MTAITGATRVAGVIGDPVRHSLSPVLHNAAYMAMGLDWAYVAFEVPDGATSHALEAMRTLGLAGLSVTMPHKTAAAHACDALSDDAATLLSVNTVTAGEGGRLKGSSTDGEGFLRALTDAGCDPQGRTAVVLGAGGAARAVALALGRAGARVNVTARRPDAAASAAGLGRGEAHPWAARTELVRTADLVVNATPVGMQRGSAAPGADAGADDGLPVGADAFGPQQFLVDLVYHPVETPLLLAAGQRGATVVDGLGMLVHQAALQIEQWTADTAPVAVMRAAAKAALAHSH